MTILLYPLAALFLVTGLVLIFKILRIVNNSEEVNAIITTVKVKIEKYKHIRASKIMNDRRSQSKRITHTPTVKFTDLYGKTHEGIPLFYSSLLWKPEVGETVPIQYYRTSPEQFILKNNNRTAFVLFISGVFIVAGVCIGLAVFFDKIG